MLSGRELAEQAVKSKLKLISSGYKLVEPATTEEDLRKLRLVEENFKELTCLAKVDRLESRSQGVYDPQKHRVKVTKCLNCIQKYFGTTELKELYLQPHEALYLIEMNDLLVYFNDVIVSLEQAYSLFLTTDDTIKYTAYSWLLRTGYIVQPFKLYERAEEGSSSEVTDDDVTETDLIWSNLANNIHYLNRCQFTKTAIPPPLKEEFESIKEQFLSATTGEPPPRKKSRPSSPVCFSGSYLPENDIHGYEDIFLNQLPVISDAEVSPTESNDCFDFNLYTPEKSGTFARSNPPESDFYAKVVENNFTIDVETLRQLKSTAGKVKVMIVIVFENLSVSSYLCE